MEGTQYSMWEHYTKISDNKIKCNHCNQIYKSTYIQTKMKVHLCKHNINIYDDLVWKNTKSKSNLIWQYYTKKENYTAICNICKTLIKHVYNIICLKSHFLKKHQEEVTKIQKLISNSWLSSHFSDIKDCTARCIHCDRKLDILIGIDLLANHLHMFHNINENSRNGNKTVKNNVDILPSLKRSWAWQHYTSINKSEIKCNHCNKIYKGLQITSNKKQHLHNFHKISNNNEWKNFKTTHNLVWQYFTKEEGYTAKCTICNQLIKSASDVTCLKSHLTSKHKQEVINIQETIKRAWLIRHFAINNDSHTIKCIHCKRKLTIFLGINGLENHLLTFHGINDSTRTERQNEENGADIMMPQLVNDKSSANASSHQNDCAQAMENKKRQRLYYESIQDQPIMQRNTLEQMLRSDKTSNNDNLTADALTSQDISKCLKPDEETGRNIVGLRMQYMTNESNIASSKVYQEAYLRDITNEEDRWFHYRAVWNQQTMTSASQQTLQTHNATNIEVCPYGYLAFSDTNRYSKSDEETRRITNMAVQFSFNGKNNTCFYQENSHLPVIGNERSQWLYYKAIEDLQTFMLKSSKQVIAHQLISNTSNHYHFAPDTFTFHNIYEYSESQKSIRENPTNIFFST